MNTHFPNGAAIHGIWPGTRHFEAVRELNERCIELLAALAETNDARRITPVVSANQELWTSLDTAARHRISKYPLLLIDANLANHAWWRTVSAARLQLTHAAAEPDHLPEKPATELAQELIRVIQQIARVDLPAACFLLGITSRVADILATIGMSDIARIAPLIGTHMRPRWSHSLTFWRNLLLAARQNDEELMTQVQLHGLQLLGSEIGSKAA